MARLRGFVNGFFRRRVRFRDFLPRSVAGAPADPLLRGPCARRVVPFPTSVASPRRPRVRLSRTDLRIALRSFARHRTFSIVAVVSLGLAIALNTTMYSVLDAMIAPRVDVAHPDELASVYVFGDRFGRISLQQRAEILRSAPAVLVATATYQGNRDGAMLEHGTRLRRGSIANVSPNMPPIRVPVWERRCFLRHPGRR